jgi:REP element-mobilizing transposase RayT
MIDKTWCEIPDHYPGIELDVMQIMPNHLHGIIVVREVGTDPILFGTHIATACLYRCIHLSERKKGRHLSSNKENEGPDIKCAQHKSQHTPGRGLCV